MENLLEDIPGSDTLEFEWGERFRGWYRTVLFKETKQIPLGSEELTYQFKVAAFQYRFVMPARIEFMKGLNAEGKLEMGVISYSNPERLLGVFRFPKNETGFFQSPLSVKEIYDQVLNLTPEQMKDLIQRKKVLTFEAFRIPFFGYEYYTVTESDFLEIEKIAGKEISSSLRSTYDKQISLLTETIKQRILSVPNNLQILQNVLDLNLKNDEEISLMTGGILHFGI